ncbi:MAG: DUF2132 domain-containing protein [Bacteroidetes bacterium]|nr:DUF2132 domain-containing protein [Bacteroidota bacterium]
MSDHISKDPLHGKTLQSIMEYLIEFYGWTELAARIRINCFAKDMSLQSSLKFLRKTKWARDKVESLYIYTLRKNKSKNTSSS